MTPLNRVAFAQDFFRFAYLVGSPISFGLPVHVPEPPALHTWGKHSLGAGETRLDPDTFALCGTLLERLAYRLLAMELDSALASALKGEDRFGHSDAFIRDASTVIRLIRNTVAHNVLEPVWKIDRKLQDRKFTIDGILTFDTTGLNGRLLKRLDFGGPIALFRLSERIVGYLAQGFTPMTHYLKPNSPEWLAALESFDQVQAAHTRTILRAAGREDVCSICGDEPASDYKLVSPKPYRDAVATIRLCEDCVKIRKMNGQTFQPFGE